MIAADVLHLGGNSVEIGATAQGGLESLRELPAIFDTRAFTQGHPSAAVELIALPGDRCVGQYVGVLFEKFVLGLGICLLHAVAGMGEILPHMLAHLVRKTLFKLHVQCLRPRLLLLADRTSQPGARRLQSGLAFPLLEQPDVLARQCNVEVGLRLSCARAEHVGDIVRRAVFGQRKVIVLHPLFHHVACIGPQNLHALRRLDGAVVAGERERLRIRGREIHVGSR